MTRYRPEDVARFLEQSMEFGELDAAALVENATREAERALGNVAEFITPGGALDELAIRNAAAAEAHGYRPAGKSLGVQA